MVKIPEILKSEEEAILVLRELYEQYGYGKFRMSKFEEYDFYVRNKSFLQGDDILTFNDLSGKLLALKPDITLSIVKNIGGQIKGQEKVYYNENVYRAPTGTHEFREIMQVGLECIGEVDLFSMGEVIALAARSLRELSPSYIIDISHIGLMSGLLEEVLVSEETKEELSRAVAAKNVPEIQKICRETGIDNEVEERFTTLAGIYGPFDIAIKEAAKLAVNETTKAALTELMDTIEMIKAIDRTVNINLDFSIINDMRYYNGIVFQGFIEGISAIVLSGGRFDKLLQRLGKKGAAIGFAVYLGVVDRYRESKRDYDVDVLLIYEKGTNPQQVAGKVKELQENGKSVAARTAETKKIRYRRKMRLTDKGVMKSE